MTQKALYNALRMRYLQEPEGSIEEWKVADYRALSLEEIFSSFREYHIALDKALFKSYADQCDGPEELAEWFIDDQELSPEEFDRFYLFIFELWRRLMPEKPTISILCDELDAQIFLYDEGTADNFESLQDALSNLYSILEENVDHGLQPQDVLKVIVEYCAHDIEHFLYDFVAELIDQGEIDIAVEYVEQFYPFIIDKKWFDLLRARILYIQNEKQGKALLEEIVREAIKEEDFDFYLDLLLVLRDADCRVHFIDLAKKMLNLIDTRSDFITFAGLVAEFFHQHKDQRAQYLTTLLTEEVASHISTPLTKEDPDFLTMKKLLEE